MSRVFRCALEDKGNVTSFHYLVNIHDIIVHSGVWLIDTWIKEYIYLVSFSDCYRKYLQSKQ